MKYIFLIIFLSVSCLVSVCPLRAEPLAGSGCSVSNTGYLAELAIEYERLTGVEVFVKGGGSVTGIDDLRSGRVDFAASCMDIMKDNPFNIRSVQVAWDALVFIVHKSNPVESLPINKIRSIYSGEIKNWKQFKGDNAVITVFMSQSRKGLSGVDSSTRELVLQGREPGIAGNIVPLASSGIVEQMVEKTPGGFAATGFSSARKRDVKMLKIDGVKPTKENITAGRYPFRRPLFILLPEKPKKEVEKFVGYALSAEGQKFISSLGAISLTDME
ncbi:MAG: phosphate ABC transporter substrate-binding protein [Nitrospiraceae bacterium]|nr:MAG: phosphate ABC transporter substrate-binding protein [Nitrospiraceae bacterium]